MSHGLSIIFFCGRVAAGVEFASVALPSISIMGTVWMLNSVLIMGSSCCLTGEDDSVVTRFDSDLI